MEIVGILIFTKIDEQLLTRNSSQSILSHTHSMVNVLKFQTFLQYLFGLNFALYAVVSLNA